MKRWQVILTLILGIGIAVGSIATACSRPPSDSSSPEEQIVQVQRDTLISTVSAMGTLTMPHQAELTFGGAGEVSELTVKAGSTVKKGQVMATLDSASIASLQEGVAQARYNLQKAEETLEMAENPYSDVDIALAEAAVADANVALSTARDNLEKAQNPYTQSDIALAEAAVERAKRSLESAREDLDFIQEDWAERTLEADDEISEAIDRYKSNVMVYYSIDLTDEQIYQEPDWITAQEPDWPNIPPLPPGFPSPDSSIEGNWEDLTQAKENLDAIQLQASKAVVNAESSLSRAEDALGQEEEELAEMQAGADPLDVEQKQKRVAVAQANLEQAEEELAEMQEGADPLEVELKKAELAAVQAALDDALEKLEMATIVAPFDGVVAEVRVEEGETVSANTVVALLVDPGVLEVSATVDEIDVTKVETGQGALISVDALPEVMVRGMVEGIAPLARVQSGIVSYEVTIALNPPLDPRLKDGMTALATLIQRKDDVLMVPNRALSSSGQRRYVEVVVNGEKEQRQVQTGLSNEQWTEITSGLEEGESVVAIGVSKQEEAQKQMPGIFGPGGGIGGIGGGKR